jgi:nicotinate-nucleotide adenylyltransferase
MKVGVLGGTFDPVHIGHLIIAEAARDELGLDQVLFIPAGDPWRKARRDVTPAEHRLAMLRIGVEGDDRFAISDIELRRAGPTYTADTLAALAGERLDDAFWFIVGADAMADLPNWHEPQRIVAHAMIAVCPRDAPEIDATAASLPGLQERMVTFAAPRIDVSSTMVRERLAAGRAVRYIVPHGVEAYIREHGLYAPEGQARRTR